MSMQGKAGRAWTAAAGLCLAAAGSAWSAPLVIKVGSLAPEGSPWHELILQMGQDFAKVSNGQVTFRVYGGGILGDEPDLVKKLRFGQVQAVGVTTVGLGLMDDGLLSMQVPLMFDSYEELDYVRDRMNPTLEAAFEKKGFILLAWTDGGWIHFFTKKPVNTMEDMRRSKLFVWAGDVKSVELYTTAKFHPVPLAVTDMLPGLQTGLIDAFDAPPLAALLNQWFGLAQHMNDLKWAPLLAGFVISKKAWMQIPAEMRPKLLDAAHKASKGYSAKVRSLGDEAIPAMVKRGLKVVHLPPAEVAVWKKEVEKLYPAFRGKMGPAAYFDSALKYRDEYRARTPKAK